MNSVEGFLNFAGAFLDIRLGVISSVEKETTSQVSDLTDAENEDSRFFLNFYGKNSKDLKRNFEN